MRDDEKPKELLAVCGNDCSICPRYTAKTDEELHRVAELWYKVGWRDRVVTNEEISCNGCSIYNHCRYKIIQCTERHKIARCNQCTEYPCITIEEMLEKTKEFELICKEVCTEQMFYTLKKAFFEKKENLKR